MGEKGFYTLKSLCSNFKASIIKAVVTSRDPNMKNDYYDEIILFCKKHDINFIDRINDSGEFDKEHRIAISWRWIIPSHQKLIVFHDSLLPRYRGFAPLVNALINKEEEVGVTALFASHEYDKGKIIAQKSLSISYPVTIAETISKIVPLYQKLAIETVSRLLNNTLGEGIKQDEEKATYSIWRDDEDYFINWNDSAENIVRFINAVSSPYLGAYSLIENEKVRVLEAEVYNDLNLELRHIGKVVLVDELYPVVIAQKGLVKITKLLDMDNKSILPLRKFRIRFK